MNSHANAVVPIALVGTGVLSGMIACMSLVAIPAVAMAPVDVLSKQWQKIYHTGRSIAPPFAITSATSFAFLAYQTRDIVGRFSIPPSILYAAAAITTPCIVPYTVLVMSPNLERLEARADGKVDAPGDAEVKALLQQWKGMNLTRAFIVGFGAVLGSIATVLA